MSQPDQTTNIETTDERPSPPPAGGAAALAAAAERKKRHVPTAKVAKRTPASGAHGEAPNPPPQQVHDEPDGRPEGKDTGDRSRGAHKPAQAPLPPPAVHQDEGTEPHGQSSDAGAGEEPSSEDSEQHDPSGGGAIVQRPQPVSFNLGRLMAPKPSINPFEYESLKKDFETVTKRVINNVRILGEAVERFGYIVEKARKEGFPEDEIHRWAEQAGIEVPPAEPQR